jgi:hypothetical protein
MRRIAPVLGLFFVIAEVGAYFVHGHFQEKAKHEEAIKLREPFGIET